MRLIQKAALKRRLDSILMCDKYWRILAGRLWFVLHYGEIRWKQTWAWILYRNKCFIASNTSSSQVHTLISKLSHFTFNAAPLTTPWPQSSGHVFASFTMWTNTRATKYIFVLSVRRLQEEQQLRTSSLPAIPNPFPELCSPASSPVLSPGSLPPGEPPTGNYVSQNVTVVNYLGIYKTTICRALCMVLIF